MRTRYTERHPADWTLIEGSTGTGPWCKAQAVEEALQGVTAETLIVADADVWCDHLAPAVQAVLDGAPWAVPHWHLYRFDPDRTADALAGVDVFDPNDRDRLSENRYRGHAGGGIVVLPTATYRQIPLDPRFEGWGGEDDAWALALRTLAGKPWRTLVAPLWHLWHPPQERVTRRHGNDANVELLQQYRNARHQPGVMRRLVEEARCRLRTSSSMT